MELWNCIDANRKEQDEKEDDEELIRKLATEQMVVRMVVESSTRVTKVQATKYLGTNASRRTRRYSYCQACIKATTTIQTSSKWPKPGGATQRASRYLG